MPTVAKQKTNTWIWVGAALAAHAGWGAYPVLARYLQTVSKLPSLSLLAFANTIPLVIMLLATHIDARVFRQPLLWAFALVVASRSITNLLAARYTLAIYVQLITLLTPFIVALLSATLFRDIIPPYTGRAMTIALVGAVLMMSGKMGEGSLALALRPTDWLGIGLALTSSFFLAMYMVLVRRTVHSQIPAEAVFIVQLIAIVTISTIISCLLGEPWSRWGEIGGQDWLVFAVYSIGVFLGANLLQISALRHLGAPMVSSLLASRLISALLVASFMLGERLTTLWQGMGALIVFVTITWYLWQQSDHR